MLVLPFELVAQIFAICVHENGTAPSQLLSINRYLRQVALNVPELWSHIDYSDKRDMSCMLTHLTRSGVTGLSIELVLPQNAFLNQAQLDELIEHLTPHFNRIYSLMIIRIEGLKTVPYMDRNARLVATDRECKFLKTLTRGIASSASIHPLEHFKMSLSNRNHIHIPPLPASLKSIDMLQNPVGPDGLAEAIVLYPHLEVLKLKLGYFGLAISGLGDFIASLALLSRLHYLELAFPDDTLNVMLEDVTQKKLAVLSCLKTLKCSPSAMLLLPYIYCPALIMLSIPIETDQSDFLRRHAKTIVALELSDMEDMQLVAGSQIPSPLHFESLHSLSACIASEAAGRLLSILRGVALVHVDIQVHYRRVAVVDILKFLEAASPYLETVTISDYGDVRNQTDPMEFPSNLHDPSPIISFLHLKRFVSGSELGDMVVSSIKEAPELLELQLHGKSFEVDMLQSDLHEAPRIHLQSLVSLTVCGYSPPLARICSPVLKKLRILSVHDFYFSGSCIIDDYVTCTREVILLIARHKDTLSNLLIAAMVHDGSEYLGPMNEFQNLEFPCLTSASLCPNDILTECIYAPNLKTLELRYQQRYYQTQQQISYKSLQSATTVVLNDVSRTIPLLTAMQQLRNITHLRLRLDPECWDLRNELLFLYSLSKPWFQKGPGSNVKPSGYAMDKGEGGSYNVHKPDDIWLFPILRSIEIHFTGNGLVRLGQGDFETDDSDDDDYDPSMGTDSEYDPAEFYSDSDLWDLEDRDEDVGIKVEPFRGRYVQILAALRLVVEERVRGYNTTALDSVRLTGSPRAAKGLDIAPPEELAEWFRDNLKEFEVQEGE